MKLDRNVFKTYSFSSQAKEVDNYKDYKFSQIIEVFNYLQSVAYNFELNNYPKMDKTIHSCRKNG
jgi:hypothetical protein